MSPVSRCGEFPLLIVLATLRSASGLDAVEHVAIDDCRVLALVHLAAIGDLTDIHPVFQHVRERTNGVALGGLALAVAELAGFRFHAFTVEGSGELADGADLDVE